VPFPKPLRLSRLWPTTSSGLRVPDESVAAGKDQTFMAVLGPANAVRRTPVLANFEDLGIPIEVTDVMTSNDESITLLSMH